VEVAVHATPEQSAAWLRFRMAELGIGSLEELAERCGSDKGNLSRIFRQQQRPRVDALEPLAAGLEVGVYEVLVRIGAVDPDNDIPPVVTRTGRTVVFSWPKDRTRATAGASGSSSRH
jgi:transcriptional regulator with XRE-family HTH domain